MLGLGLGLGATACFGSTPYRCQDDAQCVLDGQMGVCEAEHYCSLPDDDCDSRRRFSEHAPPSLANRCVESAAGTTAGEATGEDATASDSTAGCDGPGCCEVTLEVWGDRSCAVVEGRLLCWGQNDRGQLGDPADAARVDAPREVPLMGATVHDLALGDHACAALDEGVVCWGPNESGQVVQGAPGGPGDVQGPTPATDPRLAATTAVGVGERWSCALPQRSDDVLCWGQLDSVGADSNTVDLALDDLGAVPMDLVMTQLAVCIRAADGRVWCAGNNTGGALGRPATTEQSSTFLAVPGVSEAVGLASARDLVCAWTPESVTCWGRNNLGEGGIDPPMTMGNVQPPTTVDVPVEGLAQSTSTTCAVADGQVRCWGQPLPGLTGTPDPQPQLQEWLADPARGPIAAFGLGTAHACLRTEDGEIWCWGDNALGQLGIPDGDTTPRQVALDCPG